MMDDEIILDLVKRGVLILSGALLWGYCLFSIYAGEIFAFYRYRFFRHYFLDYAEHSAQFIFTLCAYFSLGLILITMGRRSAL